MSLLSELRPAKGAEKKSTKRLGRGDASGQGGTSGKGHKGQLARAGGRVRRGFEGGQMPLHRRMPKFGFKSLNPMRYQIVNLKNLDSLDGEVTPETLMQAGLIKGGPVKILGMGQLTKKLSVKAHSFSEKAKQSIEAAGGQIEVLK